MRVILALALVVLVSCSALLPAPASLAPRGLERAFTIDRSNAPALIASGEGRLVSLRLRNSGAVEWGADGQFSYAWAGSEGSTKGDVVPLPSSVAPGTSVDLIVPVVAPLATGSYTLRWSLSDAAGDFQAQGADAALGVEVRAPDARATWSNIQQPAHFYADVTAAVTVSITNAGTVSWPAKSAGAIGLSYHWRDASGRLAVWDGQRTPLDGDLDPGDSATLTLRVAAPAAVGRYVLELDVVREGLGWFGGGPRVGVDVAAPSYAAVLSVLKAPARVTVGQPVDIRLSLKNAGTAPLPDAGARRARVSYHVTDSQARTTLWNGPRTEIGKAVGPGETVELAAVARAPEQPGRYKLTFELVQEGVTWFTQRGSPYLDVFVEVIAVDFKAHFSSTDANKTMATGLTYTVRPTIVNVGASTWPKSGFDPVRVGAHWLDASGAPVVWDAAHVDLPKDVGPQESLTLPIEVTAPDRAGAYTLVVDMVQDGIGWFAEKGTLPAKLPIAVAPPTFRAAIAGALPARVQSGAVTSVTLTVRNDGPFAWPIDGDHPVHLAHHWRDAAGNLLVWDGFRTDLPHEIQPGETVQLPVWFFAPRRSGTYVLEIDVVQEDITWFAERGSASLRANVTVTP